MGLKTPVVYGELAILLGQIRHKVDHNPDGSRFEFVYLSRLAPSTADPPPTTTVFPPLSSPRLRQTSVALYRQVASPFPLHLLPPSPPSFVAS